MSCFCIRSLCIYCKTLLVDKATICTTPNENPLYSFDRDRSFLSARGVAIELDRAPVAQLVEHRAVTREVVSSTPAGPTLRVFK